MKRASYTTGSLVWHLALRWRAAVDRALVPLAITHAQYVVLASLDAIEDRSGPPTQQALTEYTGLRKIYVSKLVKSLVEGNMIDRGPDMADARAVRLSLTPPGKILTRDARAIVLRLDGRLTQELGGPDGKETAAFKDMVHRLLQAAPEPGERDDN